MIRVANAHCAVLLGGKHLIQQCVCSYSHIPIHPIRFLFGLRLLAGLDIGYVPAGPDAFFRWSGQFGPQQLIFYWPVVFIFIFFYFFCFVRITIHI